MENEKSKKKINPWLIYWVFFGIILLFAVTNARADEPETTTDDSLEENPVYQFLDTRAHTFNDIVADEDTYNAFKTTVQSVNGVTLPDFELVNSLGANLMWYAIGNYVNVSPEVFEQIASDLDNTLSDLYDYIYYDLELGKWLFGDGADEYVKNGVDHYIRTRTDTHIGNWYPLPWTYGNTTVYSDYDVYFTRCTGSGGAKTLYAVRGESSVVVTGKFIASGATTNFTVNTAYTGTEYSGVYRDGLNSTFNNGAGDYWNSKGYSVYSDNNMSVAVSNALSDFFGDAEEEGGYQIQGAHVIDDNFHINPLSVFPSNGYDFGKQIVNNYNNDNDVTWDNDIVNYYPTSNNYEVPYWLVTPSIFYPQEPDFLDNVAVDVPVMSQGGFIQVVYEDCLPAGIVVMITASLSIGILFRVLS